MRIGIISDLHSNPDALQAVFDEFDRQKVEKMIFIGDILGIGHRSEECVKLLMSRSKQLIGAVSGNHEGYFFVAMPKYFHGDPKRPIDPEIVRYFAWNHSQLSQDSIEFLRKLPKEQTIETDGAKIFVTHYPTGKAGVYDPFIPKPTLAECEELFKDYNADVYLFGHTHFLLEQRNDHQYFINPGSVGCPIETNSASAGILDIDNGKITYQRIDAYYDIQKVIDETKQLIPEYPAAAEMLHIFFSND
ncbi:metallophosphoesterase family protein [Candidatus Saccharibacteria bacterium]|nr:metallophosphoesterase family protein [Candidatus Saccharibacteria bacterium]